MATIQAKDIAAIFDKLRDQRDEARAETTRVLSELVACQDQRAALRANVEILKISVETLQGTVEALQAQRDYLEKQLKCTK